MRFSILITALLPLIEMNAQTPSNDLHWQLVWEDNFNTLNTNMWQVADHFDHYGEPQVYKAGNVSVNGGNLIIQTRQEMYNCPSLYLTPWHCSRQDAVGLPYSYTSGWVESKQAYNTQYGYIESRIKIPYGFGFWPAFWTFLGDGVSGSNAAEIDIFEMLGHLPNDNVTTNIHYEYPDGDPYFQKSELDYFDYTDWHIYGVEWSPDRIVWYIDGHAIRTYYNHSVVDPVRIILNTAIEPLYQPTVNQAPFPSDMRVDYVKVYDLKTDCNTTINACSYNFATYDNKVKKEITIGGSSCVNSIPANANITLRATDGILINGDFTVPNGAQLYLDVSACH